MNTVDHVLIAVPDIEAAAALLRERYGLITLLPGGSPFDGVANAVIPLGPPAYLELVAATDPGATPEASRIAEAAANGARLFTWVAEPDDFPETAERIGIAPNGEPDAGWQTLGGVRPDRPFFIRYSRNRADREPGWRSRYDEIGHPAQPGGFTFLEVGGDETTLRNWAGQVDVPLRFVGDEPRLAGVGIASPSGEIVLRDLSR